jgi:signal peptidase I
MINLAFFSILLGLLFITFIRFNFAIAQVTGTSMFPTLEEGDRLLIFKLLPPFWLRNSQIVVSKINQTEWPALEDFWAEMEKQENFISISEEGLEGFDIGETEVFPVENIEPESSKMVKRIIGLPGDTVTIALSSLNQDLQSLLQSRANAEGNLTWIVPKNHCFLKGDGQFSMDSVLLGCLPLSTIEGIMVLKLPRHSLPTDSLPLSHPIQ